MQNTAFKPKSHLIYLLLRWVYFSPIIKSIPPSGMKFFMTGLVVTCLLLVGRDHKYILDKITRCINIKEIIPKRKLGGVEIHSTINSDSVSYYIVMVLSLWHYSGYKIPIITHDDGTLSSDDIDLLVSKIPGIKIIRLHEADLRVFKKISRYPLVTACRLAPKYKHHLINLIDIFLFASTDKIIYVDSDILFYSYPTELIQWVQSKMSDTIVFLNDCDSVYTINEQMCKKYFHCGYIPKFNMGILGIYKKYFDLDKIENFLKIIKRIGSLQKLYRDQTYWMIFTNKYVERFIRLPASFNISLNPQITPKTICCHYVTPVRYKIYADAIRLLIQMS